MIYTFSDIALAVAKARSGCERLLAWDNSIYYSQNISFLSD